MSGLWQRDCGQAPHGSWSSKSRPSRMSRPIWSALAC